MVDPPVSTSQVLGLKASTTFSGWNQVSWQIASWDIHHGKRSLILIKSSGDCKLCQGLRMKLCGITNDNQYSHCCTLHALWKRHRSFDCIKHCYGPVNLIILPGHNTCKVLRKASARSRLHLAKLLSGLTFIKCCLTFFFNLSLRGLSTGQGRNIDSYGLHSS